MLNNAEQIHSALALAGTDPATLCDQYGSPVYIYAADSIRRQYARLSDALEQVGLADRCHIHYAVKANDRLGILRLLRGLGAAADLVSIGEMQRTIRAGFDPVQLVYSGVGKTADDLRDALNMGIGQINIESLPEVSMLAEITAELRKNVRVAFRLNPDTHAGGHANISTGGAEHKFGMSPAETLHAISTAQQANYLTPIGIALHIGSQITDISAYRQAFDRLNTFLDQATSIDFTPELLDLGGGFAIDYQNGSDVFDLQAYANCLKQAFSHQSARLMIEPGRFLVAASGILLFRTILEKQAAHIRWIITEMAMNDVMRPALYQARHRISVLTTSTGEPTLATLGGPVCESTDKMSDYVLPPCHNNAILAMHDVGAYCAVMANSYNARKLPTELLLDEDELSVLRRAVTTEDWLKFEV